MIIWKYLFGPNKRIYSIGEQFVDPPMGAWNKLMQAYYLSPIKFEDGRWGKVMDRISRRPPPTFLHCPHASLYDASLKMGLLYNNPFGAYRSP